MLTVNSEWLCAFPTAEVILITCQLRRPPPPTRTYTHHAVFITLCYTLVINYARLFFLFFRGRLKINHLQRGRLMRWEKTPLYNLKISFLSTRSKTDGKTMEWQRASSDVMMCSFFSRRVFATTAEAPLQNALPVGTSSQRQFCFWKTVDA